MMSEHRDTRRQGDVLRLTAVPAPRASGISNKEAGDEDRRLKEKCEHGIHLVVPPRFSVARIWGDIMI